MTNESEKMRNPWKTVSTKVVYENKWMTVHEDQIIAPDGSPGIYGRYETEDAVGVVAVTDDEEIILIGQYRHPSDYYSWEIVEGAIEKGEDPAEAARRELREEAGAICESLEQLGPPFYLANARSNERAFVYVARGLEFVDSQPDTTEVLQEKRVSFDTAREMIGNGQIDESISLVALLRFFI